MTAAAPRPLPYEWKVIKAQLQARIQALLPALGVHDRAAGGLVAPLNVWRRGSKPDRKPGSFVIWTGGDAVGGFKDYACGPEAQGDVFDLIVYTLKLRARIDAYWWALDFLGLDRGRVREASAAQLERQAAAEAAAQAALAHQADEAGRSAELFRRWLALPPIAGTLAETYLREARRIPIDRLAHPPGALRFASAWDHTDPETGEVTSWPCMVAAMTRGKRVVSLHRTFLAPDGRGKAPVAAAKMMIGPSRGAAIRLSAGPSGLSPSVAAAKGRRDPLAIGEGIETCLTVAAARPDYRVWAAGSLSLMGLLDWPDCASAVVLLGENDWKPEARKAFGAIEAHWRKAAAGRPVVVAASAVGSDFNDWAREAR